MKGYDFRTNLAKICPNYSIETDNDGQIIIYTNLKDDGKDNYIEIIQKDLAKCTRCNEEVEEDTLTRQLDWRLCEICVGDI
jgi:hypothetical protein